MSQIKSATRVSLFLEIHYRTNYARTELTAVLKNMSLSGGYLQIDTAKFMVKDKFKIEFVVGERERLVPAEVVWKNAEGIGVRFLPKSNQDRLIIEDLLYFVEEKQIGREIIQGNSDT